MLIYIKAITKQLIRTTFLLKIHFYDKHNSSQKLSNNKMKIKYTWERNWC